MGLHPWARLHPAHCTEAPRAVKGLWHLKAHSNAQLRGAGTESLWAVPVAMGFS